MGFAIGAILSFLVVVLMITGDVEKVIHFKGILEEMVFTLFVGLLGIVMLGGAVSSILQKD